jgi:hypothetical protein
MTRGRCHIHDPTLDGYTILRGDNPQPAMLQRADGIPALLTDMDHYEYSRR